MTARRPHLALVVTLSEWGGAQSYIYQLACAASARYEVTVLCGPGGPLIERLRAEGVPVVEVPAFRRSVHPLRDAQAFRQLTRFLTRTRVDLLHANSTKAGLLARLAGRMTGVRAVLFTAHGWAFTEGRSRPTRWLLAQMERIAATVTTGVICVSRFDRDLATRLRVAPPERMTVIHNGVDPAPFSTNAREASRRALGVGAAPTVLMVGRLAPPKDPIALLEALRELPAARLVLAGDGPLRAQVEEAARRLGLTARLSLLGFRDDIPDVLQACDVFVLPSRWEGLPLAVIEAMMAGRPVVATHVGGIPELVEHGVTGLLVPPGDVQALQGALGALLADRELRARMGAAGRQRALERFTAQRMVRETMDLYDRLVVPDAGPRDPLPGGLRR